MATVGLLTIGNEIVDGQIVNSNAAWLSQALLEINFKISAHVSVKDKLEDIHMALDYLSSRCDFILTTGGLGPTVDDCTRGAISQWLDLPLKLDTAQWQVIQEKLKSRNVTLRNAHKNQAYSPDGARSLDNPTGIAPGFAVLSNKPIAALPGPPRELQSIWADSLSGILKNHFQAKKEESLKTWICFGTPESDVQDRILDLLTDHPDIEDIGFRLHRPYVEVKAWYSGDKHAELSSFFNTIESKLGPSYIGPSIEAIRKPFIRHMKKYEVLNLIDPITNHFLFDKIHELGLQFKVFFYSNFPMDLPKKSTSNRIDIQFIPVDKTHVDILVNDKLFPLESLRGIPFDTSFGRALLFERFVHLFTREFS